MQLWWDSLSNQIPITKPDISSRFKSIYSTRIIIFLKMSGFSSPPLLDPHSQAPPSQAAQQATYTARSGHGSVGPVIGVLAVITILGAMAVMIGRLCSGRRIMGRGMYDFEGWVESKCGPCINGRLDPPPPRVPVEHTSPGHVVTAVAAPPDEEDRDEEEQISDNHQHQRVKS